MQNLPLLLSHISPDWDATIVEDALSIGMLFLNEDHTPKVIMDSFALDLINDQFRRLGKPLIQFNSNSATNPDEISSDILCQAIKLAGSATHKLLLRDRRRLVFLTSLAICIIKHMQLRVGDLLDAARRIIIALIYRRRLRLLDSELRKNADRDIKEAFLKLPLSVFVNAELETCFKLEFGIFLSRAVSSIHDTYYNYAHNLSLTNHNHICLLRVENDFIYCTQFHNKKSTPNKKTFFAPVWRRKGRKIFDI